MSRNRKIIVAVTGASGALYADLLLKKLMDIPDQYAQVDLVFSDAAKGVWKYELPEEAPEQYGFSIYEPANFWAPMASGSAGYDTMIVIPCTMGTLGRIAGGQANDLITRAADVMMKERQRLILVTRETPYNLIHLRNMVTITEAGGIICDANPSFYSKPADIKTLAMTVVERVLKLADFETEGYQWGQGKA